MCSFTSENDKFEQFKELLKYPMMDSDESKFILSLMFTNCTFGENGVVANNNIQSTPVIDVSFRHPLMVYDFIFKIAMDDIIKTIPKSKNINDFSKKINPRTNCIIYSNLYAIINFFVYQNDMIPNADHNALNHGFIDMGRIAKSAITRFAPDNAVKTKDFLEYDILPREIFIGSDKMMWFLCFSDISWTIDLINSTKDKAIASAQTLPISILMNVVEPPTQTFFDLYASGIKAIALNEKPTHNQLGIMFMIFYIDSICYYNWVKYHTEAGLFDYSMITQANIIVDNTIITFDKISSVMEAQGMSTIQLPLDIVKSRSYIG